MGFFDNKPKKKGLFDVFFDEPNKNDGVFGNNLDSGLFENKYRPDAWRKHIPYNDTHDSHIWDWDAKDKDGDGYRDGSVGDSDLWDD